MQVRCIDTDCMQRNPDCWEYTTSDIALRTPRPLRYFEWTMARALDGPVGCGSFGLGLNIRTCAHGYSRCICTAGSHCPSW